MDALHQQVRLLASIRQNPSKPAAALFQVVLLDIRRLLGRWRQGIFLAAQPRIETIQA